MPGESRAVDAELHEAGMLDFGDVNRAAIRSADAQITRTPAQDGNLVQDFSLGRHFDDGAVAVAADVEISVYITPHAVEAVVFEAADQFPIDKLMIGRDREAKNVL